MGQIKSARERAEELRDSTRVPDLNRLPPTSLLTTRQVSLISGYAEITFKVWRGQGGSRGPKVTYVEGRPRYFVRDVRAWISLSTFGAEAA